MTHDEQAKLAHEGLKAFADDGELVTKWVVTLETVTADGAKILKHRYGGGMDGTTKPIHWDCYGMAMASVDTIREALRGTTRDAPDDPGP